MGTHAISEPSLATHSGVLLAVAIVLS